MHAIESGESLYTIARKYNVTAQAIMQANGITSPDKIYVGQKLVIPGRADLAAKQQMPTKVASIAPVEGTLTAKAPVASKTAAITDPKLLDPEQSKTPVKTASIDPARTGTGMGRSAETAARNNRATGTEALNAMVATPAQAGALSCIAGGGACGDARARARRLQHRPVADRFARRRARRHHRLRFH